MRTRSAARPAGADQAARPVRRSAVLNRLRILVADADPGIRRLLRRHFSAEGCVVLTVESGCGILNLARRSQLDLAILSTDLPDIDGASLIERVHGISRAPIIALMPPNGTLTPSRVLDCGADDWIDEPFSLKELMVRSRRLLQRAGGWRQSDLLIAGPGSIEVDLLERRVRVRGKLVALTRREFELLALLVAAKGATLTHDEIVQQVWGRNYSGARQNLRRTVSSLRRKIEPDAASPAHLLSVRGSGYRLSARPDPSDPAPT
jgi:two-component system KDP operon response regulator KdpE